MQNSKLIKKNQITDLPHQIPIWVINRESDTERLELFRKECMKIGYTDVVKWTAQEHKQGQTGLGLTFISMFNATLSNARENRTPALCLTFEDDTRFTCAQSWMWFWKMWQLLPPDWDVFLGGAYGVDAESISSTPYLKKVKGFSGCHMVLWNAGAMQAVLERYDPHSPRAVSHIDRFLEKSGLNIYLCDPQVAVQAAGLQSTIGPGIVPDRFSRQTLLTPQAYRDADFSTSTVFRTETMGRN